MNICCTTLTCCLVFFFFCANVIADTESPNWLFVVSATADGTSYRGDRYAKCIPNDDWSEKGTTKIYLVGKDQDVLEHTYNWYSMMTFVCAVDKKASVVRYGTRNRGYQATTNDLAIAFYYDGRLLKWYSTLDLAGQADNVRSSVSHYSWCERIRGYGWINSAQSNRQVYGFTVDTINGRTLCFDVKTGELIKDEKAAL